MPDNIDTIKSIAANHWVGMQSGALAFLLTWPIDTATTRIRFYDQPIITPDLRQCAKNYLNAISPNQQYKGAWPLAKSFANFGFGWGLGYNMIAGGFTFPLQHELEQVYIERAPKGNKYEISLRALAGWQAAFIQLLLLHPVDTLKVKYQKNPDLYNEQSARYFLSNHADLRRGIGVVGIATLSHFFSWHAKLYSQAHLKEAGYSEGMQTTLSAFIFSVLHISIAFPFNTLKTWAQGDDGFKPKGKSFSEKTARTLYLLKKHVKESGMHSLYRGFFTRGSMHMMSFSVSMAAYDTAKQKKPSL